MRLLVVFLLLVNTQAQQQPCSCSCCYGQSCNPAPLPTVYVQQCTLESCLVQCRSTYPQCQVTYPYGEISAQCLPTTTASSLSQFKCRCDCCNTGSAMCSPSYVGETLSFTCQTGACSIACNTQYPYQCPSGANGLTQGTCTGIITTTTTTTTIGPWLGNSCSCMCCQTSSNCLPTYVGTTSASYCSSVHCTQACRIQYPSLCPTLLYTGQTNGTCTSGAGGNAVCKCRCCGNNNCLNYDISTNGGCSTCDSLCRTQTRCTNTNSVTFTCQNNNAKKSFPSIILILTIIFFTQ
jgi:hypothetical protein